MRDAIHEVNGAEAIAAGDSATRGNTLNASSQGNKVIIPLIALVVVVFLVALGVLLDTLIVRSVLVTALNLDVGRHMWWPSKLAKEAVQGELPRRRTDARQGAMSGSEKRDRKR